MSNSSWLDRVVKHDLTAPAASKVLAASEPNEIRSGLSLVPVNTVINAMTDGAQANRSELKKALKDGQEEGRYYEPATILNQAVNKPLFEPAFDFKKVHFDRAAMEEIAKGQQQGR